MTDIELTRDREGVEIATNADDHGTPELAKHKPVVETRTNEQGETRKTRRTQDLLDRLEARGTITEAQHKAGRKFEQAFFRANINPTQCVSLESVTGGRADLSMAERTVQARQNIYRAMDALGGFRSPAANAAWHVLGNGMSIKDWARRESYGLRSSMNEHTAKGVLISALAVLAGHWGYG